MEDRNLVLRLNYLVEQLIFIFLRFFYEFSINFLVSLLHFSMEQVATLPRSGCSFLNLSPFIESDTTYLLH